mmetsp:Transcript_16496/g.37890  ORF Transcript_16496/g.37890 Transcript_16496/m.37890 type:complete len:364 (+) Transcript_16496:277-1368(+)
MYQRLRRYLLLVVALSTTLLLVGCISSTHASSSSTSIPRSSDRIGTSFSHYPPWNPSPNIDKDGFILPKYNRISGEWEKEVKLRRKDRISLHNSPATIRQVPGDGNCLFHSISVAWVHATNGTHLEMKSPDTMEWLYRNSAKLRQLAVDCLEERRKLLFLQGQEYLKATDLVEAAAAQYGISGSEYCGLMRQESYWGGGPEIVALCNVLQRPIHVYELHVPEDDNDEKQKHSRKYKARGIYRRGYGISSSDSPCSSFVLRRMACFGSPKFDRAPALHILSADSRFPDLRPGEQLESGNHFLAIFPEPISEGHRSQADDEEETKQLLRGGGSMSKGYTQDSEEEQGSGERSGWFRRFGSRNEGY